MKDVNNRMVHQLFEAQAQENPDRIALVGEGCRTLDQHIGYRFLNEKANQLARFLKRQGIGPETPVAIVIDPGIEMIVGIMGVLKAGGAYLPIDPAFPQKRILYIIKESGVKCVLTRGVFLGLLKNVAGVFDLEDLAIYDGPVENVDVPMKPGNPVYILYTSGSTGRPKGAIIEHQALINILQALFIEYPITPHDAYLFKTTFLFDVSASEIFGWFLGGSRLVVMGESKRKNPLDIIAAIEMTGITHINFAPSMFNTFLEFLDQRNIQRISTLRYIFLAGEALAAMLVRKFKDISTRIRLENIYGPTENTIYTSKYSLSEWDGQSSIPIGKPISGIRLYIRDGEGKPLESDIPGELFIGGTGLARGYLNNPELTAERFTRTPATTHQSPITNRLYRTGDLCRWLSDGNIEFLGRIDFQVKIRGIRIELGEIEAQVLKHPAIKGALVVAIGEGDAEKAMCAYLVVKSGSAIDAQAMREFLAMSLPDYMVPTHFVFLERMPLNPNGKIDRKALPKPGVEKSRHYVPARGDQEQRLVDLWSEVLFLEKARVDRPLGIDDNFFDLGGHSLKAASLISRIYREFDVSLSLEEVFKRPTIRQLSTFIDQAVRGSFSPIPETEKKDYYPLSSAQKRLYILNQLGLNSVNYNLTISFVIEEKPDLERLTAAFRQMIARHESLRTSFSMIGDEPVQRVLDRVEFELEVFSADGRGGQSGQDLIELISKDFIRPFDLAVAPLLRVGLVRMAKGKYLMLVDMHHIISDGVSIDIFQDELVKIYGLMELAPLARHYRDYAEWQQKSSQDGHFQGQKKYWLEQFPSELPVLGLPTDFPRPAVQSFAGAKVDFRLAEEQTRLLNDWGMAGNATLYMVLLGLFEVLLARLCGQEEIIVGSPAAGRKHPDVEPIIGMFVNTLPLRSYPAGEKSFIEFLHEVRHTVLAAFENQDFQFEALVEELKLERDVSRNPIFDVMFVLQNMEAHRIDRTILDMKPYRYITTAAKFDLTLIAEPDDQGLALRFEYCTRLFTEESIRRFAGYFERLVEAVLADPGVLIKEIDFLGQVERQQLVQEFNAPGVRYRLDQSIHGLFAGQVERTPDRIAIVGANDHSPLHGSVSYKELDRKAAALAGELIDQGVCPNTIVALQVERSTDMIVGILGILKAGGAYLPLDPDLPGERVQYMLADSGAEIVIGSQAVGANCCSPIQDSGAECKGERQFAPTDLAYVIYTSGSTGRPKGVMIGHHNLCPLLHWGYAHLALTPDDRTIQNLSYFFDWSAWEIFITLTSGASLHLINRDILLNPRAMIEFIQGHGITALHCTPSQFQYLLNENLSLSSLRHLCLGAEKLDVDLLKRSLAALRPDCRVYNMYGPTEATIMAAVLEIDREMVGDYENLTSVPIGRFIGNTALWVLDRYLHLCPVRVAGELYIGGHGLARGYLNNPELTAERFITSPLTPNPSPTGGRGEVAERSAAAIPGTGMLNRIAESPQFVKPQAKLSTVLAGSEGDWCVSPAPDVRLYKTGDLCSWLSDGTIEFLGRIDFQVKIRGYRIELGEIEVQLLKHPEIKETVVLALGEGHEKRLCAYLVTDGEKSLETQILRDFLSRSLPDYMIPAHFVFLKQMPLNANGKIDRKTLPQPEIKAGQDYVAPRDEVEEKLVSLWADVLGIEAAKIGIDANFFQLGGHSLKGTVLTARILKDFQVLVTLADLFKFPTVRKMAEYLGGMLKTGFISVPLVEKRPYYPLSSAQEGLYILSRLDPAGTHYNIPMLFNLDGEIASADLAQALAVMIERHESLRTSFVLVGDEPKQRVLERVAFELEVFRTDGRSGQGGQSGQELIESAIKDFIRPFDLAVAPLMRAASMSLPGQRHVLMIDVHHLVFDGVSMEIFRSELETLFEGLHLPSLKLQYKDFAVWEKQRHGDERFRQQQEFWLSRFQGELPRLGLPLDFTRPSVQSFVGRTLKFTIDPDRTRGLAHLAQKEDVTLFMILHAIFDVLLSRLTGQEDVIVGSPVAGRGHADLEGVIGMFVNILALRVFPVGEKGFSEFLHEVRNIVLAGFDNQEYPFENLVAGLALDRDVSRNPLFDVMFALQNQAAESRVNRSVRLTPREFDYRISKFDLTLLGESGMDGLVLKFEYCTRLFTEGSIRRFAGYFDRIIWAVLGDPGILIKEIDFLGQAEKRQIVEEFNDTATGYRSDHSIHGLFAGQVEKSPDRIAIVGANDHSPLHGSVSYKELDRKAAVLAGELIVKGVVPNTIVALQLERSIDMIVAILGILKAGGAYLPIDPEAPAERVQYMLHDSGAEIVIGYSSNLTPRPPLQVWRGGVAERSAAAIPGTGMLNRIAESPQFVKPQAKLSTVLAGSEGDWCVSSAHRYTSPVDLAYVIYTSGSTGRPKGVMIGHYNVCPLLHWGYEHLALTPDDRTMQNVSYFFDWSVWEIFITLTSGAGLYITPPNMSLDPMTLKGFLIRYRITVFHLTPSQLQLLLNTGQSRLRFDTLRCLCIGAEKLDIDLIKRTMAAVTPGCRVYNMYGPTEATIMAAVLDIDRQEVKNYESLTSVPIGRFVGNTGLWVLDRYRKLCPVKVAGELYIGGAGLARGYLNNPELTAEKFVGGLYRTGDLCRWLEDGTIEFLGRLDFQVKIRGYRIELHEIESRLKSHERVSDAVVLALDDQGGTEKFLCAYVVLLESAHSGPSGMELRRYLARTLPEYMIPASFVFLPGIPLTANGKVDRKALPLPEKVRSKLGEEYELPAGGTEERVALAWQEVLGIDRVGVHDRFFDLGGNSMKLVELGHRLSRIFSREIPVLDLFQLPNVRAMSAYLGRQDPADNSRETGLDTGDAGDRVGGEDIAVIGMAGRFPGAANVEEFWSNLSTGVMSISFFSLAELVESGISLSLASRPDYIRAKGVIQGVEYFDSYFFGFNPREAGLLDPQLRLYHECCWSALEDAGYYPDAVPGAIGVYSGATVDVSWMMAMAARYQNSNDDFDLAILWNNAAFANRIAYNFGLTGPAVVVQTACSSSLTAIHLAGQGLRNRECDLALAGGVSLSFPVKSGYLFREGMIGSSDGLCRAFDARADGTVKGDGLGVVVLKRLPDALADRDHIYAVMKGSAMNNDGGRKVGYTAPSASGQAQVIRAAFKMAGISPESISYVEAHGTGTALGDPIEIEGLKAAFATDKRHFCRIGSVKTNIGHLDTASGVVGFMKAVLALEHRLIPPSLHFDAPNPVIDFEHSPFVVNRQAWAWERGDYPLRAGVSSFGIGGTNVHVVLEEAPIRPALEPGSSGHEDRLIVLSAQTSTALERATANLRDYLEKNPHLDLDDVAYTLQVGRKSFRHRRLLQCQTIAEVSGSLRPPYPRKVHTFQVKANKPRVIFMFSGLGAQYAGMGYGLYEGDALFRQEMDNCFAILAPLLGFDLKSVLYPGEDKLHQIEIAQMALFVLEYSLARTLMARGIKPDAMIGYSFGEYVAACLAGVFSLEDVLKILVTRGRLISALDPGLMVSVPLPVEELRPLLAGRPLAVAIDNGPSCLVAGAKAEVEAFEQEMKQGRCLVMRIPATRALHSPMMGPIVEEFSREMGQVRRRAPNIPYISNVSGTWITDEQAIDAGYWARHLEETVQFAAGIKELVQKPGVIFLEIGPGRDLNALLVRHLQTRPDLHALDLVRSADKKIPDVSFLQNRLGRLWLWGGDIDWHRFYTGEIRYRVSLPTYSFDLVPYPVDITYGMGEGTGLTGARGEPGDGFMTVSVPRPELETEYLAPQTPLQETLQSMWEKIFGFADIGIGDDFFDLGGDSLKAMNLGFDIQRRFDVRVPLEEFFTSTTIRHQAEYIENAARDRSIPVPPVEEKEYYPASSLQERLFILEQFEGIGTAYNLPVALVIEGNLDRQRLKGAFQALIDRHESLRTGLMMIDGQVVQRIHERIELALEVLRTDGRGGRGGQSGQELIELIIQDFVRPFDLAKAPLLRVGLVEWPGDKHLLVTDMHHIVSDGTSLSILTRDFCRLYQGQALPPLPMRYRDFSDWQHSPEARTVRQEQKKYWLTRLAGPAPALNLYTDFPRSATQSFAGDQVHFVFDADLTGQIKQLAHNTGTTLYMVLLSIYNVLLSKYSGSEDIVVGTPIAGREQPESQDVIGLFINPLPMRNFPGAQKTFGRFLAEVKENTLLAYENQGYPFGDLLPDLGIKDNLGRNPLFDVELVVQNMALPKWDIPGLAFRPVDFGLTVTQVDISLYVMEVEGQLRFDLIYCTGLFKKETMERFGQGFREVTARVLENKDILLRDIKLGHRLAGTRSHVYEEMGSDFVF